MNENLKDYFNGDEMAMNVWKTKYAQPEETSPDDMHLRMAKEFARADFNYAVNKESVSDLSEYGKELFDIYSNLSEEGLTDRYFKFFEKFRQLIPQGSIMATLGTPAIASLSNCFVVGSPENSYGGIMRIDEEQVQLMKRRGGVGIDLSSLQPAETPVNNSAKTSTGAVSFAHRYSNTTREVAQNGRRGALMLSMHINHPDILDFIFLKRDLSSVTGANISVKISDEFMDAVENEEEFILRYPVDLDMKELSLHDEQLIYDNNLNTLVELGEGRFAKRVSASYIWKELVASAHGVAEPGILFWDTIVGYSPDGVYPQFKQVTTNPCGEIPMQAYDACRLFVSNLYYYVDNPFTNEAKFNKDKYYKSIYEATRMMDNIIDLEVEYIDRILSKVYSDPETDYTKSREIGLWLKIKETALKSRRTGLGYTALGDMLAAVGLKYDSEEGMKLFHQVMRTKMKAELACTIDLAIQRGAFAEWDVSKEFKIDTFTKEAVEGKNDFYEMLLKIFPEEVARMVKFGRRNLSWSTVAPTGSVSILTQTTSGIEPLFSPFHMRRKKINPSEKGVRVDFIDDMGDHWQEFPIMHPKFKDWVRIAMGIPIENLVKFNEEELSNLFTQSPWFKSTANDIDWTKRVKLQSIAQIFTTHSISSTINLPKDVTTQEVSTIYMEAWKQGLKGITVYRDGSRSGVLVNPKSEPKIKFTHSTAPKRPKDMPCEIHTTTTKGRKYNAVVGMMEGKPYEVFITKHFTNESNLTLRKMSRGRYDLYKATKLLYEDISAEMTDEQEAITRLVSTALRHGADIKFIVEQLQKTSSDDMFTFTKSLARVLKKYIPNGAKSTLTCENPECKSTNVVFQEGCNICLDCGHSACS